MFGKMDAINRPSFRKPRQGKTLDAQGSGQEPLPIWWFFSATIELLFERRYTSLFKIEKIAISSDKMADWSCGMVLGECMGSRNGRYDLELRR